MIHSSISEYASELKEIATKITDADWNQEGKLIRRVLNIICDEIRQFDRVPPSDTLEVKKAATQILSNVSSEFDHQNLQTEFACLFESWDNNAS